MDKVLHLADDLIEYFLHNNKVCGIFLSGSVANNTYDLYSDVDLRLVVITENITQFTNDIKIEFKTNSNLLFFEPCPYFNNAIIAHFNNFIKADIFFYTKEMLIPSVWLKDIKILKDDNGYLELIKNKSKDLDFDVSSSQIENQILKFFATSHECFRRIQRGELLYANQLLMQMKSIIVCFYDYFDNRVDLSFYKVENRLDKSLIKKLNLNIAVNSDNIDILNIINNEFLDIESDLLVKKKIVRDLEYDRNILFYYQK